MLKFSSSSTAVVNSKKAIAECLENALVDEENTDCDLVVIYATVGHNLNDILGEAHKIAPSAQIVGCTCSGIIGKEGPNEAMRCLAIMTIKGRKDEYSVAIKDNITGQNSYEVGAQLAKDLKSKNSNVNMIHFLASGIDIAADKALEGIESVFGRDVPIFGATSSDNMKAMNSFQFVGDQIFEKAALAIGFADPTLEVITQASHGFAIMEMPFEVTRSESNRVYELNGKPAWECLTENLGLPETAQLEDTIPIGALAEELPKNLHEEYGNTHILRVIAKKGTDGSIYMPVECPKGTKLHFTKRDEDLIFDGLDQMVGQIVEKCNGRKPVAVFHADCVARGRGMLNRVLKDEIVARMQYPLCNDEDVPWLGMYGLGEFARLGGRDQFHNYTTALYVIVKCNE
ncbi:hypothetical protein LI82_12725 [Methanococcoides methylutens]|uniref:FIST domain-containing protein n=1 Tax=Methanococcoides methylutens TaxID=2226 RepID=A0A099T0N0_METMT|nr:FIST N-terminal domain-containing protein [Methanococcoides methylutens]KGK97638.1 hypothetical protein LI82_12725 [Methanococcoides methylutens]